MTWPFSMSLPGESYWTLGFLSLLGAGLSCLCYRAFFSPLARFPGPWIASFTNLWQLYHNVIGDWHEVILTLHQKHGRIVRLAPNELSVVDESAMKTLYGHGTSAIKGDWYKTWQPPGAAPNIFATQDEQVHAVVRRRMAPAFKMTALLRLEGSMQDCLDRLWQRLHKSASEGKPIDACYYTDGLAWDIIGQLCYGEPLGFVEGADGRNIQNIIFGNFVSSAILGHVYGGLIWMKNPIFRLFGTKNTIIGFFQWSSGKVREHEVNIGTGGQQDMTDHFLAYVDSEGKPATHLEVVDSAIATIGAGADTVAVAIRSALYYLSTNRAIMQKLQAEIDTLDASETISYRQTQQLPYLKAVIRESLRMYPSIPAQLPRNVPAGGMTVDGQFIPSGTIVGISGLAQNRDSGIFGRDVDTFNPERWLGDETKARYLEASLFNFGGTGPRSCPGRDLAMIELYKFVAQMVQKFDFELLDKEHPFVAKTYFFNFQSNMPMRIVPRGKQAG